MPLPRTETVLEISGTTPVSPSCAVDRMLQGQIQAIEAVQYSKAALIAGADMMAEAITSGHALHYIAAGSSGLMALADASELPGTFGIPQTQIFIHMAGGVPTSADMPGDTEDDSDAARAIPMMAGDVAILLSASGATPYVLAAAEHARRVGAKLIGLANNPDTPLLQMSDIAICLQTPPEFIAGSTRLGAGTAQKAALNVMSSLMGMTLGHVFRGRMVNLVADNAKLRQRAAVMVCEIADVSQTTAREALERAEGRVKLAILLAAGVREAQASALLAKHKGHLEPCLNHRSTDG